VSKTNGTIFKSFFIIFSQNDFIIRTYRAVCVCQNHGLESFPRAERHDMLLLLMMAVVVVVVVVAAALRVSSYWALQEVATVGQASVDRVV
jgi:hypothetical protein